MGDDETFLRFLVTVFASLTYIYAIVTKLATPAIKLLATLPIIFLYCKLPWQFSGLSLRTMTLFMLTWLTNFKLLLYCFNSGPLYAFRDNLLRFLLFAALPVHPKFPSPTTKPEKVPVSKSDNSGVMIFLKLIVYTVIFVVLFKFYSIKDELQPHTSIIMIAYSLHVYMSLDGYLTILVYTFRRCLGVELEPQFNHPYFSSSLSDFWGRRWNLIIAYTHRQAVYQPVRSVCLKFSDNKDVARSAGVFASFLVSGLMHEVTLYSIIGAPPVGEWLCFFVLHALLMIVEDWLRRRFRRWGIVVPKVVSVILTLVVVYGTGMWLFFAPLARHGLDVAARKEVADIVEWWSSINGGVRTQLRLSILKS